MQSYILILVLVITAGIMVHSGMAATTISLTGSCQNNILNSSANTISFNLLNSGNGKATNLEILPLINGANVINQNVYIPYLRSGNEVMTFHLDNFSIPGGYIGLFSVKYSQGRSTFFSVFPCFYYIKKISNTKISILKTNITNTGKYSGIANISIFNFGTHILNVTLKPFAPLNFNITPKSRFFTIKPKEEVNYTFNIHITNTASLINASFPIGFSVNYIKEGVHYSTPPYIVLFHEKNQNRGGNFIIYALLSLVTIIIILIIISLIINFKKNKKHSE